MDDIYHEPPLTIDDLLDFILALEANDMLASWVEVENGNQRLNLPGLSGRNRLRPT
jgi:hypothetical protein